jgi:hypothetical protein
VTGVIYVRAVIRPVLPIVLATVCAVVFVLVGAVGLRGLMFVVIVRRVEFCAFHVICLLYPTILAVAFRHGDKIAVPAMISHH